jgi:hypothetical protein
MLLASQEQLNGRLPICSSSVSVSAGSFISCIRNICRCITNAFKDYAMRGLLYRTQPMAIVCKLWFM